MPSENQTPFWDKRDRVYAFGTVKICIIYLVFGIIWIIFSDKIFLSLARSPDDFIFISSVKGVLFIVITTVLLFLLIRQFTIRGQESEKRFRAIFNSTFQFTGLMKPDGTLIEANQTALSYSGVNPDQIINKPFWEARWWRGDEKRVQGLKDAITRAASGEFVRYEVEILGAGDARGLFDFSIKPVLDENGTVVLLIPEARDITERKRAEDSLKESLDTYTRFFKTSQDCVFITTKDGQWVDLNDAAVEMFGYFDREELLRVKIPDLYTSPEERSRHIRTIAEKGFTREYPVDLKKKDGTVIHTLITTVARYDMNGNVIGFQGTIRDISEQKRMEIALQLARTKLNLLNSVTFNDIQNALFSLSGYLNLETRISHDEKSQYFHDKQVGIVRTITDSLKFASQYQNLGLKPPSWQSVTETFLLAVSHLDLSALSRKLDVAGLEIYADPLFENVFFALAENVLVHNKTATEFRLYYQKNSGGITLIFENNGTGIQEDMKERIFERGYEEKKGPGLFLAREILGVTAISINETGEPAGCVRFEIFVPDGGYRFSGRE
ncbi:MAG: PAS domain S-box protein [Methanoregula sp.]